MKLRRLRFEAIGHRDARLAPLLLDLTGDPGTPALDTVLGREQSRARPFANERAGTSTTGP